MLHVLRRAALAAAVAGALGTLTAVGVAPPAAGQAPTPAPAVENIPTPAPSGVTSTSARPGRPGVERFAATTGGDAGARPAPQSLSAESVILAPGESASAPDGRQKVPRTATDTDPLRRIGQIEFVGADFRSYLCSGFLIDENSVLTAGHCSFDGINGDAGMSRSATFYPGRNRGNNVVKNPYGSCNVTGFWAPDQWRYAGRAQYDYSVQQLDCDIGATIGWFGMYSLDGQNAFAGRSLRVEGYPGDKPFGSRWTMPGNVHHSSNAMLFYPIDTYAGQSGSPVFRTYRASCGGPCAAAVHAYGAGGNPLTNSGPRLTAGRISQIVAVADLNDPPG